MNAHDTRMAAIRDNPPAPFGRELPARSPFLDRITETDVTEAIEVFLACIVADNSLVDDCGLEPDDFDVDLHRTVFSKVIDLRGQGLDANPVSLKPFIPKTIGGLDISPAEYLSRLAIEGSSPFVMGQMEKKVQIIKQSALARNLKREATFASEMADEGHSLITLADEIEKLEARLRERRERFSDLRRVSDEEIIDGYLRMITGENEDGTDGIPLPFPDFEYLINDNMLRVGRIYGMLGASAEGKTSMTLQVVYSALMAGHPVCYLSFDQEQLEILAQMAAQQEGIPFASQIQNSRNHQRLSQDQIDKGYAFVRKIKRLPFEVISCSTSDTVPRLETKMDGFLRRRANGRMPLFIFDHIRAIRSSVQGDEGSKALQIGQDIKDAMKARRAAGWILQQRSTSGLKRENPRPASVDLYGGDAAKQPFDVVFYVFRASEHRDEQVKTARDEADAEKIRGRFSRIYGKDREDQYIPIDGFVEVGMIKNRFGNKNRRAILAFDPEYTRFSSRRRQDQGSMFG